MLQNDKPEAAQAAAPVSSGEGFYGLGISAKILAVLEKLKFTQPTPIQHKSIPSAIEGKDIIGIAQTGTGKTYAFGIPMIQSILEKPGRGLVVLPTRELALQVEEAFRTIGGSLGLRTAVLIGGASMYNQTQELRKNPHVIIGTPGRINDHLTDRGLSFHDVRILVLDEADHMFDMGFLPQINMILRAVPKERQTMLFSATMPAEIVKLAVAHMALPVRIEVAPAGTASERVEQEIIIVRKEAKFSLLEKLLKEYMGAVLVFSRTKHGARKISQALNNIGFKAAEIHSNRSLYQRKEALAGFKNGKYRVLVATDIAARGIDVSGIELVINYDLPDNTQDYVHRIGRTGRAGKTGKAISFAGPDQSRDIRDIERLIRKQLPVSKHEAAAGASTLQPDAFYEPTRERSSSSRGPRRFSSGGGSRFSSGGRPSFRSNSSGGSSRPGGFSGRPGGPSRFGGSRSSGGSSRPAGGFNRTTGPSRSGGFNRNSGGGSRPGGPSRNSR